MRPSKSALAAAPPTASGKTSPARDQRDSQRAVSPLMIPLGAKVINNSGMTAEQTSAVIIADDIGSELAEYAMMNPVYFLGWRRFGWCSGFISLAAITMRSACHWTAPVILACNHASFLDPPLVGAGVRRGSITWRATNLFRFPVWAGCCATGRSVPVDREGGGAPGLKAILERLLAGGAIIFFPEGRARATATCSRRGRASA